MSGGSLSLSKRFAFAAGTVVFAAAFVYLGTVLLRGSYAYYQFKVKSHAWAGRAWQEDPELGYAHVPGFRGIQTLAADLKVPVWIDERGFRIPSDGAAATRGDRPLVLAFGDSNTFGQGSRAEETYTFLVARELGGSAINAAVSGYGLLPMLLRARRLIPQYKPDVVLIGYAPGLEQRSMTGFSETRLAAIPIPYFYEASQGTLGIQEPLSESIVFDLGLDSYWPTEVGAGDFLSFLLLGAAPALIHRDYVNSYLWLARAVGCAKPPMSDGRTMTKLVMEEIALLASEHGGKPVVVSVGHGPDAADRHALMREIPELRVVNVRGRLEETLPVKSVEALRRAYYFWSGSPPVLVDFHYNPKAQRIIADGILVALGEQPRALADQP